MKKKLLVFAITSALVLSLTACNKGGQETSQVEFSEPVQASEQIENVTSEEIESEVAEVVEEGPAREDGERFEETIIIWLRKRCR